MTPPITLIKTLCQAIRYERRMARLRKREEARVSDRETVERGARAVAEAGTVKP